MSIYKERPTSLLLNKIEEITQKLYGHPFAEIAMNFDQSFKEEVRSLMLKKKTLNYMKQYQKL